MAEKWTSPRFASPTQDFDLDVLVSRLRKGFLVSMAIAAVLHLAAAGINPFKETKKKAPRPMTTKFIKREPRLTKPLELRKIPQPKRQLARREVQLARARMDQVQATASFNARSLIASHVGGSGISLGIESAFSASNTLALEPSLVAAAVTSERTVEHKIDMALEMLDVNSMDTGRYKAMVIQDAGDRQSIKGFVKFAQVMSARAQGQTGSSGRSLDFLRDLLNEYTGLKADFLGLITYDDPRLLEIPILISPRGTPNEAEMANLAQYLIAGGFVMGNAIGPYGEALEKYGGLVRGKDFWSKRLAEDHAIFHAFFDIEGGMPNNSGTAQGKSGVLTWNHMTGHFIKGRMVGLTSNGWSWGSPAGVRLAVNVVIYALTQEGSLTQRLMQTVN